MHHDVCEIRWVIPFYKCSVAEGWPWELLYTSMYTLGWVDSTNAPWRKVGHGNCYTLVCTH
jgi:hypothetical protein